MPIYAIAIALGSAMLDALASKAVEAAASPFLAKLKTAIEEKFHLGKYEAIQLALVGAREEVLSQCNTAEERGKVGEVLDELLNSHQSLLLDEFSREATRVYLLPSPEVPLAEPLAKLYLKFAGPVAIVEDRVLTLPALTDVLNSFFIAYRERLLREPDFSELRQYFQLTEAREQTKLQRAMVDGLDAIAANTARPVDDFALIGQEYRNYIIKEYKDHTIRGFAPQVGGRVLSLPLAKIFLPLEAIEGRPALAEYAEQDLRRQAASEVMDELDWKRRREEMEKRYAQLSVRQAAQRPLKLADLLRNARSVLLGDPGSGKTTVTRYVTYALAAEDDSHVGSSVHGLIPVLVRIANYARAFDRDSTLHLMKYIENELTPKEEYGRYLRHIIEAGEALIILDGLDEVTKMELRIRVTERIQEMVAGFSENRFLVTSRIVGYDQSPLTREFKHATLQELGEQDRERFVRLWYDAIETEIAESTHAAGADDLVNALHNKPQIARMAANPLLLTIIVLMHWRGVKLPSRRVQVYMNATDTLVEYWTQQRGVELDAEDVKAILSPIAHYILSSNVGGVIAYHDLLPRFFDGIAKQRGSTPNEARNIGRRMLEDLNEQSGLFLERGRDADDQPVFGFLHQTFGEYLAALHMAQDVLAGNFVLASYLHLSRWYEPLLLLIGHLSLVSHSHASQLLRDILTFAAPFEEVLQRNLLFGADCLADDIQFSADVRQEIVEKLAQLLQHPAPQVREAAARRYERLALTRHREAAAFALKRAYPFTDLKAMKKLEEDIYLKLATVPVHLGETVLAGPLLKQLEFPYLPMSHEAAVQRLRFWGWPSQASDYLQSLQTQRQSGFSIEAGHDLAHSLLGPVDAALARRVLGKIEFSNLIERLAQHVSGEEEAAAIRWLSALAQDDLSVEALLEFTSDQTPECVNGLILLANLM